MNNATDNLDNLPLFVKLRNPPFPDRLAELKIVNNSPFARIRLKHLGNGKYGLRQDGFDWERALAHGHRPLSMGQQQQQTAPGDEPAPTPGVFKPEAAPPPPARDIDAELTAKCGPAYHITDKGGLVINESYFVQRICRENLVLFEYDENRFYRYNTETGAWEAAPPGVIKELVRAEWERYTRLFNEPGACL